MKTWKKKGFLWTAVFLILLFTACGIGASGDSAQAVGTASGEKTAETESQMERPPSAAWEGRIGFESILSDDRVIPDAYENFFRLDGDSRSAWNKKLKNVRIIKKGEYSLRKISANNYPDPSMVPDITGLDSLNISGSAQFSFLQFEELAETLKKTADGKTIVVVDLRGESHAFLNGISVSWYGWHNWANVGMNEEEVLRDEKERFGSLAGQTITAAGQTNELQSVHHKMDITVESVMTEEELVRSHGFDYLRLACTDHVWPTASEIDRFIEYVKGIDTDKTWFHFHCHAGKGRTGIFMCLYDKMKNPDIPMKDIIYRQTMLGSSFLLNASSEGSYKVALSADKIHMLPLLGRYVEENHENGYSCSFRDWLAWQEQEQECTGTGNRYRLEEIHLVGGRQGVAWEDGRVWISDSGSLTGFDENWNQTTQNLTPFEDYDPVRPVNHIGDIDVYQNEIYCGVEQFLNGHADNIQIAVYDGNTLELKRTFPFAPESGQTEVSGIAVDPDRDTIWMCSWADGESGRFLYRYNLTTGEYLEKIRLLAAPRWIQGIAVYRGRIFLTADDGDSEQGEPDHLYRVDWREGSSSAFVAPERTFSDVTMPGEIEGLSFDGENGRLLLLYNRGTVIQLGMPAGFHEGYDREIHEVFIYDIQPMAED